MKKYSIGVDYGTLSARAALIDLSNGAEVCVCEYTYPHAILCGSDISNETSAESLAMQLQHPADYLEALEHTVKKVVSDSGISPNDVVGIGFDFTACTMLPITSDGTPLCFLEKYKNEPHAYVKLWKHHGAQAEADEITSLAQKEGEEWLDIYGGKVSSEWLFPKIYETLHKAPGVFDDAYRFIEAGDWIVLMLTGEESHSSCMAGYKGLWNKENGYPKNSFWAKLDSRLSDIVGTKISENILPTGTKAGVLCDRGSALTGLAKDTAVAVPIIDAHAALPAAGITTAGKLMIIIGTSSCHIVMSENAGNIPDICGSVQDGVIAGLCAHEAGQGCVGDSFDWFIKNCVPESYAKEARDKNISIFSLLDEKAAALSVGESGVIALDWFNGNRTPYSDADLSGMIVGLTLNTKPEDIYRAILESTAFGTKSIVDIYEKNGVCIDEVYAAGGISRKNAFLMQMYADVLGKRIKVTSSSQAAAKGSAIFASVAGGYFESASEAANVLADGIEKTYLPNPENMEKYQKLYECYHALSEHFAKSSGIMKALKSKEA
ncbi:MAG: ribulokinase [Ruminococcaceae bacterium]|nr:ribulokinase [Oscillospiraceae bacterium]